MATLKIVLSVLFIIVSLVITIVILFQEGKSAGLGTIAGVADTYWGKNKGRSKEGRLVKATIVWFGVRSQGAEVALDGCRCLPDFTPDASYGYTYATFKDYITNEKVNGELQEISYNGKYVPFVPKHTMNVGGQYIFRICRALAGLHPAERQHGYRVVGGTPTGPRRIPLSLKPSTAR